MELRLFGTFWSLMPFDFKYMGGHFYLMVTLSEKKRFDRCVGGKLSSAHSRALNFFFVFSIFYLLHCIFYYQTQFEIVGIWMENTLFLVYFFVF